MDHRAQSRSKKPSFFKTLPESIASSPSGIPRISNSAFPALNMTTQYKSVYERAGFQIKKDNQNDLNFKSPTISESGLRSQSTSRLQRTPKPIQQKRNVSEYIVNQDTYTASSTSLKSGKFITMQKSLLTIDPNLGNESTTSFNTGSGGATSSSASPLNIKYNRTTPYATPSSTTSKFELPALPQSATSTKSNRQLGSQNPVYNSQNATYQNYQPYSATSSHFANNLLNVKNHAASSSQQSLQSQTSNYSNSQDFQPGSVYVSAQSLPHSLNSYHSFQSQRSDGLGSQPSSTTSASFPIPHVSQNFEPFANSPLTNSPKLYGHATPRFIDQTKVPTPTAYVDPSNIQYESVEFNSDNNFSSVKFTPEHPIHDEDTVSINQSPSNNNLKLADSEPDSVSDVESLKSRVLSILPKNQPFNFESPSNQSINSSPPYINKLMSPSTRKDHEISSFTEEDADNTINTLDNDYPEETPKHGNKERNVSVAASSIYGTSEFSSGQLSTTLIGTSTNVHYQSKRANFSPGTPIISHQSESPDQYTPPPMHHKIENQLENLAINSPQYENQSNQSLRDQPNFLKEFNTDKSSLNQNFIRHNVDINVTSSDLDLKVSKKSESIDPGIIKYPSGEGPCRKCRLEIHSKPIYSRSGELSGQWHRSCFTCTSCGLKFSKKINCFVLNDLPYCEYHYHLNNNSLCKICGNGIVGKCLEDDANDRYHIDCLKCEKCHNIIQNDYLSINEKVFCEPCASTFISLNNNSAKIEKRKTKMYMI